MTPTKKMIKEEARVDALQVTEEEAKVETHQMIEELTQKIQTYPNSAERKNWEHIRQYWKMRRSGI